MKNLFKCLILIFCISTLFLSNLPLLSMRSNVGESCTFIIRGYNLLEFSAWACVPLFAPLVIIAISFSRQSDSAKDAQLIILSLANLICYVHSVNAAKEWLMAIENSTITPHFYLFVLPIVSGLLIFFSNCYTKLHTKIQVHKNN